MTAPVCTVLALTDHFQRLGACYAVGAEVNGKRAVRPVTPNNPMPDLDSWQFPPTYCDASEVAEAFGLPAAVRVPRCGEQLELFA